MNSSPTPRSPRSRSQAGGRRPSRPPSHLHSDCPPEPEDPLDSPSLGQRSVSLTTLQPAVIQPRMAQLETLEAKMASIEVSLSSTPRRKKNGSLGGISLSSSLRSVPKELAIKELESLRNALRDKENIIQNLRGQIAIPGLHISQIKTNGLNSHNSNIKELSEVEKRQAEERLLKLRMETDNKRLAIKNLKIALERLDITDNIDVRIQQAELEYQLGREELNLLTLLEETRALQTCLDESSRNSTEFQTLYNCVKGTMQANLVTVEILYDPKSPRFGTNSKEANSGLWIDWALEGTGLFKGDRLIEVNGKIVLNKSREDLTRLLAAAPDPAQIVLLRSTLNSGVTESISPIAFEEVAALRNELGVVRERAEESQKAKDGLVSDNIRLTHRISYLEEQVSELLTRRNPPESPDIRVPLSSSLITSTVKTNQNVTNINISTQPQVANNSKDLQIFQKGPQVTALVANLPGLDVSKESHVSLPIRSKSSMSNVSNTHIPAPSPQPSEAYMCHKPHRHKHKSSKSKNDAESNSENKPSHYEKDYTSQASGNERRSSLMDQSYKKASMIVHELTTKSKENGCYDNMYEKHRQKCITASEKYNSNLLKHYNARKSASVVDFCSQINSKYKESDNRKHLLKNFHYRKTDSRSVKSLDFDNQERIIDYTSEPINNIDQPQHHHSGLLESIKPRPTPPKKPLRLSLHKTQSLQSVETPSVTPSDSPDKNESRKPMKRNHRGETHYVPIFNVKIEGPPEYQKTHTRDYVPKGSLNGFSALKWSSFSSPKYVENGK